MRQGESLPRGGEEDEDSAHLWNVGPSPSSVSTLPPPPSPPPPPPPIASRVITSVAAAALWRMLGAAGAPQRNREFAVSYRSRKTGAEVFQRHLSFDSGPEFQEFLDRRHPLRLDVGAAMALRPAFEQVCPDAATLQAPAVSELRFDVDIDAYDALPGRTCCTGRNVCHSCWALVSVGCAILDAGLRALGARRLAWFFSGGRGMHCWVLDGASATFASPELRVRAQLAELVAPAEPQLALAIHGRQWPFLVDVALALLPSLRPVTTTTTTPTENARVQLVGAPSPDPFLGWYVGTFPASATYALRERLAASQAEEAERTTEDSCCGTHGRRLERLAEAARSLKAINSDVRAAARTSQADSVERVRAEMARIASAAHDDVADAGGDPRLALSRPCVARAAAEAAMWCMMPRVDRPVTEQPCHLLKAPLSFHPLTLRAAVYVADVARVADLFAEDGGCVVPPGSSDAADSSAEQLLAWLATFSASPPSSSSSASPPSPPPH